MLSSSLNLPKTNLIYDFLISLAISRHFYKISKPLKQCLLFLLLRYKEAQWCCIFLRGGPRTYWFSMMLCSDQHPEGAEPTSGDGGTLAKSKARGHQGFFFPMKFWRNFRKTKTSLSISRKLPGYVIDWRSAWILGMGGSPDVISLIALYPCVYHDIAFIPWHSKRCASILVQAFGRSQW